MIPENLLYSKTHEWAKIEGDEAVIGITHFAQEQLGDITFIELPQIGQKLNAGDEMGSIESVKAASEIYSPVTGEVIAVNEELENAPEKINEDPYGQGWIAKFKLSSPAEGLLNSEEYAQIVAEEDH
ncbi:glycine cleavage system protein GcvH [Desulfovulcanus ferrireducens]|jgi:glycine cleavage system H protein|uniref:glycine cleavage system protein GcvH n=1 Tax=Desulfovulcanus ferrireducens TaxID=2831190 RepID=UPI00207BA7FC|nr:glycine cleavage system protein GcvH [Desulfovulcanus ferrireducens]